MILKGGSWRRDKESGEWCVYVRSKTPVLDGTQVEVISQDGQGVVVTLEDIVRRISGGYLYRRGKTEALPPKTDISTPDIVDILIGTETMTTIDTIDVALRLDPDAITPVTKQSGLVSIDDLDAMLGL